VLEASKIINLAADREIIHAIPIQFTVDGQDGVSDPVGMSGGRLEVDTHIVTGGSSFLNNVLKCVERAGLTAIGTVFQPIAVGAAALLQEEKDVGCVLLDLGGGTLDIAVYAHGSVVHTATLPIGGNVLTNDIAHGLKTTFAEADHIKRTYGSGLLRADEPEQTFHVKTLDGRSTREVTSTQLRAIVGPRVLELFRLAKANVLEHLNRDQAVSEVVLTGGGARLRGIELTAAEIFGLPVRIGVPATVAGLTEALKQPEYAAGVGLLLAGPQGDTTPHLAPKGAGALSKLWSWFASIWN
jgi:cell division protein FtsA